MANDNTLGAPTEGLGQTVTFAADQRQGIPQMRPAQRGQFRAGASGGGAQRTAQALMVPEAQPDQTFAVLAKLGGELLKPHLEAERTAAYVQGMQKAAQGEAIAEIVDEQPWYSKVFGTTSLVDGARAYTATARATSIAVDMVDKMPELRKLSAGEFSQHTAKTLLNTKTGDETTDMMVTAEVTKTLPSVMKEQAKEHLRYQQEQLETGISASADATFARVGVAASNARNPNRTTQAEDALEVGAMAMASLERPAEMKKEVHDALIGNAAIKAITTGNFAAYDLLKDSGKLANMSPEMVYRIDRAKDQASRDARINLPVEWASKLHDYDYLSKRTDVSKEDIIKRANELNAEYTQATGDRTPLFSATAIAGELSQLVAAEDARIKAARHAADTATSQQAKEAAKKQFITENAARAVSDPNFQMLLLKDNEQQDVFNHLRATNPAQLLAIQVRQSGQKVIDSVQVAINQANIEGGLRAGDPVVLAEFYTKVYAPMVKASGDLGEVVAGQYSGRHAELMQRYHKLAQGKVMDTTMQAIVYAEATRPLPKQVGDKRLKDITDELKTGRVMGVIKAVTPFHDDIPLANPEGLATLLAPRLSDHLPTDEAVEKAKRDSKDLTILGGHYWTKGTKETSLQDWLYSNHKVGGVTKDDINRGVKHTIDKVAKLAGIDGTVTVGQTMDTKTGIPRMYVMGTGSDGNTKIRVFTGAEVHANWIEKEAESKASLQFGPKYTVQPDDPTPASPHSLTLPKKSIYSR